MEPMEPMKPMQPMEPMAPMAPMKPMEPMAPMKPMARWWPDDLGEPSTSGAQNGARYAFFPQRKRLLIERDGKLEQYDTGDLEISGASQQQGGGRDGGPAFSTQRGLVDLVSLKKLG
jgi:hypothetical protein